MIIKNLFNNIAFKYDFMNNAISFWTHIYIKKLAIKSLEIKPNSKVLDLCCGTGDIAGIVKELYPSCDVLGVDFSSEMLSIARKKYSNVTFFEYDVLNLPFEKNSFDYVIMSFGLRNITKKNKAIEEVYRILKTNGLFLHLDFGVKNRINKFYDNIILFISKLLLKNSKPYKYLVLSKNNFLEPNELIELFKFNKLDCTLVKDIFFHIISFQVLKKTK